MSGQVVSVPPMAALRSGSPMAAIVPTSIEEVFRLANAIHKSGLAPKELNAPEKLMVSIMHGLELGLPPMMAVQKIAVINGRPCLWGDAIPALLLSKGFQIIETMHGDGNARVATCIVKRPDGAAATRSFSVKDAMTAGLWSKAIWKQYPDRMLQMRARGFAARDGAADVLSGLYIREEMEDADSIAPTSAYRARKNGDYERLTGTFSACSSVEELDALVEREDEAIRALPAKWEPHLAEFIATKRSQLSAQSPSAEEAEPDTSDDHADDGTESAREMIGTAANVAMLKHVRQCCPDADWEVLAPEYDKKLVALGGDGDH